MEYRDRTFKIFNTKYKLKFVDHIKSEKEGDFTFGTCNSQTFTINIVTKGIDGKPLSDNIINTTILHELLHAIFIEGQYLNSSSDEPLVEWTAKCLMHLINQKVI